MFLGAHSEQNTDYNVSRYQDFIQDENHTMCVCVNTVFFIYQFARLYQ